jgi:hypothetical protein
MPTAAPDHGSKIFSTCPPSALAQPKTCVRQLEEIACWSEDAGCEGMLVFTDNAQLDPWLVSQVTRRGGDAWIRVTFRSFRIGTAGSGARVRGRWSTRDTLTSPPPSTKGTPFSVVSRANGGCASRADEANGSSPDDTSLHRALLRSCKRPVIRKRRSAPCTHRPGTQGRVRHDLSDQQSNPLWIQEKRRRAPGQQRQTVCVSWAQRTPNTGLPSS